MGPAAWHLLREGNLSPSQITPTGPKGNITKGDVLAAIAAGVGPATSAKPAAEVPKPAAAKPAAPEASRATPSAPSPSPASPSAAAPPATGGDRDVPVTNMRRVIARRLLESKTQVPHCYYAVDVCMDGIQDFRTSLAAQGVKLSVNDLVIKAVAAALREVRGGTSDAVMVSCLALAAQRVGGMRPNAAIKRHRVMPVCPTRASRHALQVPGANVTWDAKGEELVLQPSVDVSVAVATEGGLITPIVKGADGKTLKQISAEIKDLAGVSCAATGWAHHPGQMARDVNARECASAGASAFGQSHVAISRQSG